MKTFHLISLGCAKNFVDSEVVLGSLDKEGWILTSEPEKARFLIVNTCGFIQPAAEEAVDEILELVRLKENDPNKKIIVIGCLVQRYKVSLAEELPEVDLFVGTEGPAMLPKLLKNLADGDLTDKVVLPDEFLMNKDTARILATPHFRGWLKITEGCNNNCSYCMIPSIRGGLRSRYSDDLVGEAIALEKQGVKELSLVAQDSTAFGDDLGESENVLQLLEKLIAKTSIPWVRLLYLYPNGITDDLIALIANNSRILPYLDIPFQHVNGDVLKKMNRRYEEEQLVVLIEKLRSAIPHIALRTTFLVGFPDESEAQFLQIERFLRNYRLDHVGVFPYANEEGAPSEHFPGQIPDSEKIRRQEYLLQVQAELSESIQQKYVGTVQQVLVEGVSPETDLLLEGRTRFQAPEVDGGVYINDGTANPGDIVDVEISEAKTYDLIGGIVD